MCWLVAKKVAYLGMFTALALVLGWLESLVPLSFAVPGIKIGLANVVTLLVLYRFGAKEAFTVACLRIILSTLLFGKLSLFLYSLSGVVLSLTGMIILKKTDKFSTVVISIVGGVLHNAGQLVMAVILIQNTVVFYYFPILAAAGVIAGALVGILGAVLNNHLPQNLR